MVTGFKVLDMNMKELYRYCRQYKIGKLYYPKGEEFPYDENGFYFCKSIEGLNHCYYDCSIKNSRIFEIEADGEIIEQGDEKYVAEKIRFVRELKKEDIYGYFKQNQDKFIRSSCWYVRSAVADMGFGLDILINDKVSEVRSAVARWGYGLEILVGDKSPDVRAAVAEQGYGLEKLLYDESPYVRKAAAEYMHGKKTI